MNKFLNKIRSIENEIPITRKIINTILILCFGIVLGTFAKFLDTTASNTKKLCNDLAWFYCHFSIVSFCLLVR